VVLRIQTLWPVRFELTLDATRAYSCLVTTLETSMLWPSLGFVVTFVAYVVLLIVVPAVGAARSGRWAWLAVILLLSPLGGLMWYLRRLVLRRNATA
jgi:hypothetical protein